MIPRRLRSRRPDRPERLIRAAYLIALQREPDPGGTATQAARLAIGSGFAELLEDLAGSDEFDSVHPSPPRDPRVAELVCRAAYALLLRRDPDPGAVEDWRSALARGQSWQSLVSGILASEEFAGVADSDRAVAGLSVLWQLDTLVTRADAAEKRAEHAERRLDDLERAVARLQARDWDAEAVARRLASLEDRLISADPGR